MSSEEDLEPQDSTISWIKYDAKCYRDDEKHRPPPLSGHTMTVIGIL
jgi:hypothetical protein